MGYERNNRGLSLCGIIGLLSCSSVEQKQIASLSSHQKHRGPDEQNSIILTAQNYNIILSHQRLSILDIEAGHQPMADCDRKFYIIFNGEIYNHLELRKELEEKGHLFQTTHSDTEVIIYAYKEWGIDCFNKFNGMWAIALLDLENNKIVLSRDRLGKKPLYYSLINNELIFASELKTIKAYHTDSLNISENSIVEYLQYGYIHSPNTIYEEVKKLKPATCLEIDFSQSSLVTREFVYWTFQPNQSYTDEKAWNEKLTMLLTDAVRLRLNADVEVGCFLSGGIDSALVAAIISSTDHPITSYTIGFDNNLLDESKDAQYIANLLNIPNKQKDMSKLNYQLWDQLIANLDEPFADASIFPTYAVSNLAAQDLKVVLSGDGGDEQFLGYPRYEVTQNLHEKFAPISYLGRIFTNIFPSFTKGYKFAFQLRNASNIGALYNDILSDAIMQSLLTIHGKNKNPYSDCTNINEILFHDLTLNMSDQILTKVDRMSMLNSLEVRSPLLDYRIVEHVFSAPLEYRYKYNDKKYALKKIAMQFGIPKEHIYKNKRGFNAPINEWLQSILKEDIEQAANLRFINKAKYLKAVHLTLSGKRDYFYSIFKIVLLYKWLEKNAKN